jgi:poly[(R)-3-hydroxyalkanoate] polymerase subunit PhaC
VRLDQLRSPVLNLYALEDHIVPPAAAAALRHCVGSRDYSECAVATGHIGMYVSRAARAEVPARISAWLRRHR